MAESICTEIYQQQTPLRRIGFGFCGTVWAGSESGVAIKREDGGRGRSLKNDSDIHQRLAVAQDCLQDQRTSTTFTIPTWYSYILGDTSQAAAIARRFPKGYSPCSLLLTERIPPLPANIRNLLIEKYCPPALASSIAADPNNHDCLIRPYLGRRRRGFTKSVLNVFSLRNYPLHLDQLEDLGLDSGTYLQRMAEGLAFMHWCAKVDANDVEFVLAPPSPIQSGQSVIASPVLGDHCLWILDFDCCRPITMDECGMEQAAKAFWKNDPFYPRPGKEQDAQLWSDFKQAFLTASAEFIGHGDSQLHNLPKLLTDLIEARCDKE